jgi:dTDP-glucose pyrophosphorylase
MNNELTGVILAAGKGSRMFPFNEDYPKPLLPICNQPLIEYQILMMKEIGITTIYILIGTYGFKIAGALGDGERLGVNIRYVEQGQTLGIAHALGRLENYLTTPFLLFLGDIFFVTSRLKAMKEEFFLRKLQGLLATKTETNADAIKRNFAVIENERGLVQRVIEKPRYIVNNVKGCGLYLFDLPIFDAIRRTPRTAMRDEYELTDAIQILIDDHYHVAASNIIEDDMNLTFPADLLKINLYELERRGLTTLTGSNFTCPEGTELINAIAGDGVNVLNPIRISNSILFKNSVIASGEHMNKIIATPERIIDLNYSEQAKPGDL